MGYEDLEAIFNNIKNIQEYLRKLGPKKRLIYETKVLEKISVADSLYENFKLKLIDIKNAEGSEQYDGYIFDILVSKIEDVYQKILNCKPITRQIAGNMEKFDIRTAAALIPVMDNCEEAVEKIIDGLKMYSECLDDEKSRALLISFVLKTRLTKVAKLKLKTEYKTIEELLSDIKKYLLTKKSASSLLSQLENITQREQSISDYGKKIEELFVDLTISQADSNEKAYEILRPINERHAIKKFADGLRNRRLSTIIAARNFTELKEAVRAAEDEELCQPANSAVVMNMRGKFGPRRGYQQPNRGQWGTRTPSTSGRGFSPARGGVNTYQNNFGRANTNVYRGNGSRRPYNNGHRGRGRYQSNFRGYQGSRGGRQSMYTADVQQDDNPTTTQENSTVQFFRA